MNMYFMYRNLRYYPIITFVFNGLYGLITFCYPNVRENSLFLLNKQLLIIVSYKNIAIWKTRNRCPKRI